MLDYKLLEAMAAVVREGGFDKAAKSLCLTQSAVSQRVKLLEEQIGKVVLVRSSPPKATSAGQRVLKHYLQVKRLEEDLAGEIIEAGGPVSFAVGINADSIATWFIDAVSPFLLNNNVLLDVRVDDQEQTHRLLKGGEVIGCVSTQGRAIQGCRHEYLGCMVYRMLAAPAFIEKWFPSGVTPEAVERAPALIFNRKDELHFRLLAGISKRMPGRIPAHYIPSSERFVEIIRSGVAYGMLPDLQSRNLLENGELVDLFPEHFISVKLYWHYWNLESPILGKFSDKLLRGAKEQLGR